MERYRQRFLAALPAGVSFASLRVQRERGEGLEWRRGVLQPADRYESLGGMVTVSAGGGLGYAATPDLSTGGLRLAAAEAATWARLTAGRSVVDFRRVAWPHPQAEWHGRELRPWRSLTPDERHARLREGARGLDGDPRIVDWSASVHFADTESLLVTTDGGLVRQSFHFTFPRLRVTAYAAPVSQTRTLGGLGYCRQGGVEVLEETGFLTAGLSLREDALALVAAEVCPSGVMDVVLAPDQMVLQIHESIGHPLELDRILGDERNYAGTSFVTPEMLGSYVYGSPALNVTFDPSLADEGGTYGYDDEGARAQRVDIIRDGILLRALGGTVSQARTGLPGVANGRAHGWNRPPMDRMANLNLEPGGKSLAELVGAVARGVYLKTNSSWSIDDSRNKFQFGCEWACLIENGQLGAVVRNPGYRGISATFWRSLALVGGPETVVALGAPNCGKGEPNQLARVGHASPPCLFRQVEVFGGE